MSGNIIKNGSCLSDGYKVFKENSKSGIHYRRLYFPPMYTLNDLLKVSESFSGKISEIVFHNAEMGIYSATHDDGSY